MSLMRGGQCVALRESLLPDLPEPADLADLPDLADADLAALPLRLAVSLFCSSARQSEMRSRRKVRFWASTLGEGAEILASSYTGTYRA